MGIQIGKTDVLPRKLLIIWGNTAFKIEGESKMGGWEIPSFA